MRAANEALAQQADPKEHDIEELTNPEDPHIEMVLLPNPPCPSSEHCAHCHTPSVPQNLACGVLEAQPAAEEEPEDEPLEDLRLPSQQTAAVAKAARAGRSLVSEVEQHTAYTAGAGASSADAGESPGAKSRKRRADDAK